MNDHHPDDKLQQTPHGRNSNHDAAEIFVIETPHEELLIQVRAVAQWFWELRYWLIIALFTGLIIGAGLATTILRKQTATSLINLLSTQLENPLGPFERKSIRFFHSPVNAFTADALVQSTLERLDGRPPTPRELFETRNSLTIVDFGNDVYEVQFSHRDGARAVEFLKKHIEIYAASETKRNLAALEREVDRLKRTQDSVAKRMQATELEVRDFKLQHADSLPEFSKENIGNLHVLQHHVGEIEAQRADIAIERANLTRRLANEHPTISVATRTSGQTEHGGRLERIQTEIATLRAGGLRDQHPDIARLLAESKALASMDAEHQSGVSATSVEDRPNEHYYQIRQRLDELALSEEKLAHQLNAAKEHVAAAQTIVDRMPTLVQHFAELGRGQEADSKTFASISQVLEMAQLQLRLEEEAMTSRLGMFSPPALRFSSQYLRIAVIALAGACVCIFGVIATWAGIRLRHLIWPKGLTRGTVAR